MRIAKVLIPFILILAAGCAAASPELTATAEKTAAKAVPRVIPPTLTPSTAPQVVLLIDDFEADETAWTVCIDPECTDSSATGVAPTPGHAAHGIRALALSFEKNDKPKAVFYIEKPMDLSGGRTVRFDIYHEGTIDGVGLAFTTGAGAVWHESDTVPVGQGKQVTLSFDITAGNYKTAATNWEFRSFIADRNNVVRLSIIIYPRKSGSAILDYLYLSDPV
jgi:hypothetical protein